MLFGLSLTLGPCTTWLSAGDVLEPKFVSPLYVAVMLCVPGVRVEVDRVAISAELREELPRFFTPSKKLTVPVGVVLPNSYCGVTVAVRVTVWP
jgi:hypothetical protein